MLHFYQGSTATVYMTLSETATIPSPGFLFTFTPRIPGPTLSVILQPTNTSERSDVFEINPDTAFVGMIPGQYSYSVREQSGISTNTNPLLAGAELERGIAILHRAQTVGFNEHTATNYFIQP